MRVLLVSYPEKTHFMAMAPLAWALRTAGHEVRVASQPELTETITQTGLTAVPIDCTVDDPVEAELLDQIHYEASTFVQNFDFAGRDRTQWTWENLLGLENMMVPALYAALNNDAMVDALVAFARDWEPDLVIWETFTLAGAITARATGAAHARLVSGPDITLRARQEFLRLAGEQPVAYREDPTAEWLNWTLERLGSTSRFEEEMVTGQWTIDTTPASTRLDLGLHTVAMRFVPYHGASVVPGWLHGPAPRPRICLSLGISECDVSMSPADIIRAMADLDVEVVATLAESSREQVPEVPANTRLLDFVPLNDLLPTCSAIVHHGGIGTKATAELHGVPQVILPVGWDTAVMAERIEQLGAGLSVPAGELTVDGLREKVTQVVREPSFAESAERLRQEMLAEPCPNDVVPLLEKLTAEHGTGRR